MRVYLDDDSNTINIVQSTASASTMISSLASCCKDYILSKFPRNFIKHVYIDTSETVTQQLRNEKYNATANKIPYPSMTITPEISLDNPIGGMDKGLHMSSPNLYLRKDISRTYNKIIVDPDDKYGIYYTSDYITTNFNFKIATNSFIQNADMAFYLKSRMQQGMFLYLNGRHLQTEIPKSFIKLIADLKGYDLNNPDDMDLLRLYLIGSSKSEQAIQKRINMSTGKQCFFINEHVNLLTLFRDLDCPSSINRESQVEGEYIITFTLQVSAWIPNAFVLKLNRNILERKRISRETLDFLSNDEGQQEEGILSVSVLDNAGTLGKKETIYFTDNSGAEQIGHLVYSDLYTHSLNTPLPSINNLLEVKLGKEFQYIHSYAVNHNIDLSALIFPVVYSRNGLEKRGVNYYFDYETLNFTFRENFDNDVSVSLYVNRLLYESIKAAIKEDRDFFAGNFLTYILANIGGDDKKLVVKSFENNREQYSSDISKSLRIKTQYGVGYVSLSDDDETDSYKICLGTTSDGQPIIRKIDLYEHESIVPGQGNAESLLSNKLSDPGSLPDTKLDLDVISKNFMANVSQASDDPSTFTISKK